MRTRVYFVAIVLMVLFTAACDRNRAPTLRAEPQDEAETPGDEATIVIVAVSEGDQYVEVRNDTETPQDLSGWYLSLGRRTTCRLDEIHVQPGETLRLWALVQDAEKGGYNCGLDEAFWSRKEPKRVFLYNAAGEVVDEYFGGEG
jgi:hypothetical protein